MEFDEVGFAAQNIQNYNTGDDVLMQIVAEFEAETVVMDE